MTASMVNCNQKLNSKSILMSKYYLWRQAVVSSGGWCRNYCQTNLCRPMECTLQCITERIWVSLRKIWIICVNNHIFNRGFSLSCCGFSQTQAWCATMSCSNSSDLKRKHVFLSPLEFYHIRRHSLSSPSAMTKDSRFSGYCHRHRRWL